MKSNQEWKEWGKVDPLFAIASWKDRDKGCSNPWTDDEFYALGKSDWEDFFAQWRKGSSSRVWCDLFFVFFQLIPVLPFTKARILKSLYTL
jgi:hypothetical protein